MLLLLVVYSSVILLSPVGPGIYGGRFDNNGVVFPDTWLLNIDQAEDFGHNVSNAHFT